MGTIFTDDTFEKFVDNDALSLITDIPKNYGFLSLNRFQNRIVKSESTDRKMFSDIVNFTYRQWKSEQQVNIQIIENNRRDFTMQQQSVGIRIAEFHSFSIFARFVHPDVAIVMQNMLDNKITISMQLDTGAYDYITKLPINITIRSLNEVARYFNASTNVSSAFVKAANKFDYRKQMPVQQQSSVPNFVQRGLNSEVPMFVKKAIVQSYTAQQIQDLSPIMSDRIAKLIRNRGEFVRIEHFDKGVVAKLRLLGDDNAICVMDDIEKCGLAKVRNMSAYIAQACKQYMGIL
jgi:hypothetical protein